MVNVEGRVVFDADSHVMELGDFLDPFMAEEHKELLHRKGLEALQPVLDAALARAQERGADAEAAAKAEERLWIDKGWNAIGAFDTSERSRVLDLMGIQGQLVFATFASALFAGRNRDRLFSGASAQNR